MGTQSNPEIGRAVFEGLYEIFSEKGIFLAAQCCEHLNRALVIEQECLERYGFDQVNAIPQPNHAGGAFGRFSKRFGAVVGCAAKPFQ